MPMLRRIENCKLALLLGLLSKDLDGEEPEHAEH